MLLSFGLAERFRYINVAKEGRLTDNAYDSNLTTSTVWNISATNNDVDGLRVGYLPQRLTEFAIEEIALGFINALKLEGLKDAAESQPMYNFRDTEYADGKITISMGAVRRAPSAKTIRSSVMNALAVLPVTLMNDNHLAGVHFFETYRRRYLYNGILNRISDHDGPGLRNIDTSAIATSRKRSSQPSLLTVQEADATTILLKVPGNNLPQLEVAFHFTGFQLSKVGFFSSIIMMMHRVGLHDASDEVDTAEMSDRDMSAWIFVQKRTGTTFDFAVYHELALLEGIARYAVQQGIYGELVYDLFADGQLVSGGCVTQPVEWRRWCAGLRGETLQGIKEGDFSAYRAP